MNKCCFVVLAVLLVIGVYVGVNLYRCPSAFVDRCETDVDCGRCGVSGFCHHGGHCLYGPGPCPIGPPGPPAPPVEPPGPPVHIDACAGKNCVTDNDCTAMIMHASCRCDKQSGHCYDVNAGYLGGHEGPAGPTPAVKQEV